MGLKQLIGRDFDSEHVQALVKVLPFGDRLVPIKHPDPRFQASSVGVKGEGCAARGERVELSSVKVSIATLDADFCPVHLPRRAVRLNGTEVELPVEALCGLVVDSLLEVGVPARWHAPRLCSSPAAASLPCACALAPPPSPLCAPSNYQCDPCMQLGARKLDLSMEAPSWLHPTISVPANATQSVREAACSILAGLGAPRNRISVINEPTAALVAGSKETVPETALKRAAWLLIADLGAGTVDLTLAQRIKRGGQSVIKVECNRGDNRRLGSNGFRV